MKPLKNKCLLKCPHTFESPSLHTSGFYSPTVAQFIRLPHPPPPADPAPPLRRTWFMTFENFVMLLNVCYSVLTVLNPPSLPTSGLYPQPQNCQVADKCIDTKFVLNSFIF